MVLCGNKNGSSMASLWQPFEAPFKSVLMDFTVFLDQINIQLFFFIYIYIYIYIS